MTWNNRIFKHAIEGKEFFALQEAFYNNETGLTENPLLIINSYGSKSRIV